MLLEFTKYHGAGNDFIIFDGRQNPLFSTGESLSAFFKQICHRNFGIGADGVIVLYKGARAPFAMKYYNSDGLEGSMCGNGGRCFVAYLKQTIIATDLLSFEAIDGLHEAKINECNEEVCNVSLKMNDVEGITELAEGIFLDTGSPHLVVFCENISQKDVLSNGRELRYSEAFRPSGANVNYVEVVGNNQIKIRTYERGVENETLACGTGAIAAAMATKFRNKANTPNFFEVEALGGNLRVSFDTSNNEKYTNVWLTGPATKVFEGKVEFND